MITESLVRETTGAASASEVRVLEIVFTSLRELVLEGGCSALQELYLVDNGIERITDVSPVRNTLQRLSLYNQKISRVQNLDLPHLTELLLVQNDLTALEGLEGVPRLRKLWLTHNRVSKIENVEHLVELEELWLQCNRLTTTDGVECLASLKCLALAGNPVHEFQHISSISSLHQLQDVSFQDIHFGRCPIVQLAGYKEFLVCALPQLNTVDGVEIAEQDQDNARETYVQEVSAFNSQVESIESSFKSELQMVEGKLVRHVSHAASLEQQMQAALIELEDLIQTGRSAVQREYARHSQLRAKNLEDLNQRLTAICDATTHDLRAALADEKARERYETEMFDLLERMTVAQGALNMLMSEAVQQQQQQQLQQMGGAAAAAAGSNAGSAAANTMTPLAVQYIGEHSADFRYVSRLTAHHQRQRAQSGGATGQGSRASSASGGRHRQQQQQPNQQYGDALADAAWVLSEVELCSVYRVELPRSLNVIEEPRLQPTDAAWLFAGGRSQQMLSLLANAAAAATASTSSASGAASVRASRHTADSSASNANIVVMSSDPRIPASWTHHQHRNGATGGFLGESLMMQITGGDGSRSSGGGNGEGGGTAGQGGSVDGGTAAGSVAESAVQPNAWFEMLALCKLCVRSDAQTLLERNTVCVSSVPSLMSWDSLLQRCQASNEPLRVLISTGAEAGGSGSGDGDGGSSPPRGGASGSVGGSTVVYFIPTHCFDEQTIVVQPSFCCLALCGLNTARLRKLDNFLEEYAKPVTIGSTDTQTESDALVALDRSIHTEILRYNEAVWDEAMPSGTSSVGAGLAGAGGAGAGLAGAGGAGMLLGAEAGADPGAGPPAGLAGPEANVRNTRGLDGRSGAAGGGGGGGRNSMRSSFDRGFE